MDGVAISSCPRPVPRPEPPLTRRPRVRCDAVLEIPVFGVKNSLNVACCASIVLYEVLRRWGKYESVAAVRLAG